MLETRSLVKNIVSIIVIGSIFSGCTYKAGFVKYDKNKIYSAEEAGNLKYVEIAPVEITESGFIWESCNEIATKAVKKFDSIAKANGGNAIMNVKWYGEMYQHQAPQCQTQWGWIAFWPALFGPWVKRVKAEGTVIKIIEKDKK
jgi:hypothetical protein